MIAPLARPKSKNERGASDPIRHHKITMVAPCKVRHKRAKANWIAGRTGANGPDMSNI